MTVVTAWTVAATAASMPIGALGRRIAGIWGGSAAVGFGFPWEVRATGIGPNTAGPLWTHDMLALLWHGLGGVAAVAAGAWWLGYPGWWAVLAAGATCPFAYEAAWRWPWQIPALGCFADPAHGRFDPPPTAELLWGAAVGIGIAVAAGA